MFLNFDEEGDLHSKKIPSSLNIIQIVFVHQDYDLDVTRSPNKLGNSVKIFSYLHLTRLLNKYMV